LRPSPDATVNLVTIFPFVIVFFEVEIAAQPPAVEQGVCQKDERFFLGREWMVAAALRLGNNGLPGPPPHLPDGPVCCAFFFK
jgi:hypothetical protein